MIFKYKITYIINKYFQIPKARQTSWDHAVDEAQDALRRWHNDEQRCESLIFEYKDKQALK